jgi:two-component system cell cycle response regulator CtrA
MDRPGAALWREVNPPGDMVRKGTPLTKEMFLNHLYAGMDEPEFKIIDVFMCKLRKKLANASNGKSFVETLWGRGHVLRDPFEDQARISA